MSTSDHTFAGTSPLDGRNGQMSGAVRNFDTPISLQERIGVPTVSAHSLRSAQQTPHRRVVKEALEVDARRILRVHYADKIRSLLGKMQESCGSVRSAVYANLLLETFRELQERLPTDPFSEVAMALHDALAYQDRWVEYTCPQYQSAQDLIASLLKVTHFDDRKIGQFLGQLQKIGFEVLPIEMDWDIWEEDEAE